MCGTITPGETMKELLAQEKAIIQEEVERAGPSLRQVSPSIAGQGVKPDQIVIGTSW